MTLPITRFFEETLRTPYETLLRTQVATQLTGNFRLDGVDISSDQELEFPTDEVLGVDHIDASDLAQLLMVFNGSRVHEQPQHDTGQDDSPPGIYFTYVNSDVVWPGHKNRIGVYRAGDENALFLAADEALDNVEGAGDPLRAVHVDHFYLRDDALDLLGTVAFALSAIVAHRLGFSTISLIAGGGVGYNPRMFGYKFWPQLGFDAEVEEIEVRGKPELRHCRSVQQIIAIDLEWWKVNGTQRWMEFDLRAESPSWGKLLEYLHGKGLI